MSVYVDTLMDHGWVLRGRRVKSCHMIADTSEELHALAERIGMRRSWFQAKSSVPHYDLTASRRRAAVSLGAIEVGRAEFVIKMREITDRPVEEWLRHQAREEAEARQQGLFE